MNIIQTGILNDTFKQVKNCIAASISNEMLSLSGPIVQICKDLFIPIQNIYYHITCLTENVTLFPQSVSDQCKGYLKKLCNDTTAESIFNIYGSKLQNYIIESGKYTAPCEIVEDCNGINDEISLSTESDSHCRDITFAIIFAVLMFGGTYSAIRICTCDYDSDSDSDSNYNIGNETVGDNNHIQNTELVADDLHNTQNLSNNYYAENKYEEIMEAGLAGDVQAVSM